MALIAGLRGLRRIQAGREDIGTPPNALTLVRSRMSPPDIFMVGKLNMSLSQENYMPDDLETGRLVSFERSTPIARDVNFSYESDATYEQLAYLLEMSVHSVDAEGTAPYVRTYVPRYTEPNNPQTYTWQYGDNVQMYETRAVACQQLELSGQVGGEVRVNAGLFGRDMEEVNDGSVSSIVITAGGASYTTSSSVTFTAAPIGGNNAEGDIIVNSSGEVTGIYITNPGSGYTSAPTVTFGTPGTGATASVTIGAPVLAHPSEDSYPSSSLEYNLNTIKMGNARFYVSDDWDTLGVTNGIGRINITVAGDGYGNTVPSVTFSGGGGSGAAGIAVLDSTGDEVVRIDITNPGSGYTSAPTITIDDPTTGTTATAIVTDYMGTELPTVLIDFSWRMMNGYAPVKYVDDNLSFTDVAENKRHVEVDMTVGFKRDTTGEQTHDSTAYWFNIFRTQAARKIEIAFQGQEDSGGSPNQRLRLQASGKFTEFAELTEREGQNIVKVKFVSEFDDSTNAANFAGNSEGLDQQIILSNEYSDTVLEMV